MRTLALACALLFAAPLASAATTPVNLPVSGLQARLPTPKGQTWKHVSKWTPTTANDTLSLDPAKPSDISFMVEVGTFSRPCTDWVKTGSYTTSTRGSFPTPAKLRGWHTEAGWLRYGTDTRGLVCISHPGAFEMLVQIILPSTVAAADAEKAVKAAVTASAPHLEGLRKAFESRSVVDSRPLDDPAVSSDGSVGPRKVHLDKVGLDVTLPADGAFWRYVPGDVDALLRHVPRMPSFTARLYGLQSTGCTTWLDSMASRHDNPAQRLLDVAGVPPGYAAGAVTWPANPDTGSAQEVSYCVPAGPNALGIAMITTPDTDDATPYAPLLTALADAARTSIPAGSPKLAPFAATGPMATTSTGGAALLPASGLTVDLPRVANQTWTLAGSATLREDKKAIFKDNLSRWVKGRFVGGVQIQLGDLHEGCPEWQSNTLAAATSGARFQHSGEAGGDLEPTAVWTMYGTQPQISVCAAKDGYELYIVLLEPHRDNQPVDEAAARGILAANRPIIQAVVSAWKTGAGLDVRPSRDPRLLSVGMPGPRTVRLPNAGYDVAIPDDGLVWELAAQKDSAALDALTLQLPSATMADLYVEHVANSTDCAATMRQGMAAKGGTEVQNLLNVPSGYSTLAGRLPSKGGVETVVLCHAAPRHLVLVQISDQWPTTDLGRFVPILGAIAKASDQFQGTASAPPVQTPPPAVVPTQPPPRVQPVEPAPTPTPPASGRRGTMHFIGWWETEVALSHRDSDRDTSRWPDTRVTYLGLGMGFLNAKISGFSWNWRAAVGGSFDWRGAFGPRANTPEYGGQHWFLDADAGLGFGMGRRTSLTFGPGWHGTSGPITRNAGFTVGAMLLHLPEDDEALGWSLRVTPLFLMTRNNMNVMAPLMAEFRLFVGSALTMGVEFQYIDPEADAKRTPAKAWATIFKFGIAVRSAKAR